MDSISILGSGWLGLPLAQRFVARGYHVCTSTTSPQRLPELAALPSDAFVVDIAHSLEDIGAFLGSRVLVVNITSKHIDGFTRLVRRIESSAVEKVLFVSSTSVYPDDSGIVTEDDGAEIADHPLFVIENLFRQNPAFDTTVVRFAGLIGGSRHPGRFFRGGKTLRNPGARVNLIHLDDCIAILEQIVVDGLWGETLNACADTHPRKREFYAHAARLAGMAPPGFEDSGDGACKIVDNQKLKRLLGYQFRHPDLMAVRFDEPR